ncbi:bifunctional lysylphosphatidylglycerol flippase/synthetase MprF [Mycobacterium sp. MUNTM1]
MSEHVVLHGNWVVARWIAALALVGAAGWLTTVLARYYRDPHWHDSGRIGWSVTAVAAAALIARGVYLGRPVSVPHATVAGFWLLAGLSAHTLSWGLLGKVLVIASGLALMWPTSARPRPEDLPQVWALIHATSDDPLAPFAMQTGKCYHFSADGRAGLAYRTRLGFAAVSADPIGDEAKFAELVADFAGMCHARGWRIAVVGCSERRLELWTDSTVIGQSLRAIPIGRDVVVDVSGFTMTGRKFRNLRQAVQRTHNAGITTEIVAEQQLTDDLFAELTDVVRASPSGAHTDRGFYMNLDGVLEGRFPGIELIIARDASGRIQGFHRYAIAGGGTDISLDVPWRRRGASNGIDERLSVDMIRAAKNAGAQRVSLSFAAFPEIFDEKHRGWRQRVFYRLIHILDPLIALESLYRYVRKFHALNARRYALISMTQLIPLVFVLVTLEFMPRRRSAAKAAKARWNQSR